MHKNLTEVGMDLFRGIYLLRDEVQMISSTIELEPPVTSCRSALFSDILRNITRSLSSVMGR